jgi:hypothetical protein
VLLDRLEAEGRSIARLPGRQLQEDYDATLAAMHSGVDFIHQASRPSGFPGRPQATGWRHQPIKKPRRTGAWGVGGREVGQEPDPAQAQLTTWWIGR